MKLDRVNITGHRASLTFNGEDASVIVSMLDYDLYRGVELLLLELATTNPPKWQSAYEAMGHRSDVTNYEHFDCCGKGMVPRPE